MFQADPNALEKNPARRPSNPRKTSQGFCKPLQQQGANFTFILETATVIETVISRLCGLRLAVVFQCQMQLQINLNSELFCDSNDNGTCKKSSKYVITSHRVTDISLIVTDTIYMSVVEEF